MTTFVYDYPHGNRGSLYVTTLPLAGTLLAAIPATLPIDDVENGVVVTRRQLKAATAGYERETGFVVVADMEKYLNSKRRLSD